MSAVVTLDSICFQNQRESPSSKSGSFSKKNISKLPDPTTSLSVSVQNLARHISEMGFPLSRVARACKSFNGDDKKVNQSEIIYFFFSI